METISSRKNRHIQALRTLSADSAARREQRLFVCDGIKMLREALQFDAAVTAVYWHGKAEAIDLPESTEQFILSDDLFDYASPLKNSLGPLFTVSIRDTEMPDTLSCAMVLENVQDPGNVGTVIRSASAFSVPAVILTGNCADLYSPKTVRASMGAIFRQTVLEIPVEELRDFLCEYRLPLYGAVLDPEAVDMRTVNLSEAAVAVGSEGRGLSPQLLACCEKKIIIPMDPRSESLNAAIAASLIMWEMFP